MTWWRKRRGFLAWTAGLLGLGVAVFLSLWRSQEGVAQTPSLLPKLEEISQKLDSHLERLTRRLAGFEGTLGDLQRDQAKMRGEWNAKLEAQRQSFEQKFDTLKQTFEQKFAAHAHTAQQQQEALAHKLQALEQSTKQTCEAQRQSLEQKLTDHAHTAQQQQKDFAQKFDTFKQTLDQKLEALKQALEDRFKSLLAHLEAASRERRSEALSILEIVKPLRAGARREVAGLPGGMMRYLPPGSFTRGQESGGGNDERPTHPVTFTKGAWMLETEVTQAQYRGLMGSNPSGFSSCGDNCPVEKVSWDDAAAFANALSQKQGMKPEDLCFTPPKNGEKVSYTANHEKYTSCKGWRLPTEAEWEYAARAGTTGERYGEVDAIAWHYGNSGWKTHPVGLKRANAWGLHDMLGNVWEWCYDWKGGYTADTQVDPAGPSSGSSRVLRGGGWNFDASLARASYRDNYPPSDRGSNLGFRLLRSE